MFYVYACLSCCYAASSPCVSLLRSLLYLLLLLIRARLCLVRHLHQNKQHTLLFRIICLVLLLCILLRRCCLMLMTGVLCCCISCVSCVLPGLVCFCGWRLHFCTCSRCVCFGCCVFFFLLLLRIFFLLMRLLLLLLLLLLLSCIRLLLVPFRKSFVSVASQVQAASSLTTPFAS